MLHHVVYHPFQRTLQLRSGGFIKKWADDIIRFQIDIGQRAGLADTKSSNEQRALKLDDLQGGFYVLVFGYVLALLGFAGEWIFFNKRTPKRSLKTKMKN